MNLERKISRRSGPCVSKIKSIKTKYSIISPQDIESLSSFRNLATFDQPSQCYPASIEPANFNPTRDIETPITRRNNKKQTDRGNHSGGGIRSNELWRGRFLSLVPSSLIPSSIAGRDTRTPSPSSIILATNNYRTLSRFIQRVEKWKMIWFLT